MQYQAQIGGLYLMLCTDNNVTDALLMERNWRKCVVIIKYYVIKLNGDDDNLFCMLLPDSSRFAAAWTFIDTSPSS